MSRNPDPIPDSTNVSTPVMTMLRDQVPLSLLCDLSDPTGPPSAEILAEEGEPQSRWWEQ